MARATSSLSDFFFVHFSWFGMFPFWTVSTEEIRARSSDHLWVIVDYIISFVLFFFHVFQFTSRKKLHFPCLYISLLSVPAAAGVCLVGSGTRASRRSQLGSGKEGWEEGRHSVVPLR